MQEATLASKFSIFSSVVRTNVTSDNGSILVKFVFGAVAGRFVRWVGLCASGRASGFHLDDWESAETMLFTVCILISSTVFYLVCGKLFFSPLPTVTLKVDEGTEVCLNEPMKETNDNGKAVTKPKLNMGPPSTRSLQSYSSSGAVYKGHGEFWTIPVVELTQEQEALVKKTNEYYFGPDADKEKKRVAMETVVNGDIRETCIKMLTARQWNFENMVKMVDDMIEWRIKENIGNILYEDLGDEIRTLVRAQLNDGFCGVCRNGYPVYIMLAGEMDMGPLKPVLPQVVRYHIQVMEYNRKAYYKHISQTTGHSADKVTLVLDLKNFGGHNVRPSFWDVCSAISAIDSPYYFEWLHKVCIINAGLFFKIFWRTASPMLEPSTKKKFHVIPVKELEEHIPLCQLPERFGGELPNEGSFCTKLHPWTKHYDKMDEYLRNLRKRSKRRHSD